MAVRDNILGVRGLVVRVVDGGDDMSLSKRQAQFAVMLAEFILWTHEQGYRVTIGDVFRDPRVHGRYGIKRGYGHRRSQHKKKLAADLNLFIRDGAGRWQYHTTTSAHEPLGVEWERRGGVWGGRFRDGNHYQAPE